MLKLDNIAHKSQWLLFCIACSLEKQRFTCPNCGSAESSVIDTKFIVMQLKECANCRMRFRVPTDTVQDNEQYYQTDYSQGATTNMPSEDTLINLLDSQFKNHENSYKHIICLLKSFYPDKINVFDFGCSWGYGSWQIQQAGFLVSAYEISRPRANFAFKKLNINLIDISNPPIGEMDIFFSHHVLEHVPSPSQTITLAKKMLKDDGIFVAITPNGSDLLRQINYSGWHLLWGQNHPNYLSDEFYKNEFKDNPFFIASMPCKQDDIQSWNKNKDQIILPCSSSELLIISYPNMTV